ncbi:MAG: universal stress protein [Candidatus Obscuribacterales bacterium]|nr:universal stress protein [Candidatus Obscuribacterales bacterium]
MKVLMATDGSVNADAAIDVMLYRPWPADTQVKVITVADKSPDLISKIFPFLGDSAKKAEEAWLLDCQEMVDRAVGRLSEKFGADKVSGELITGDPKTAIVEQAQMWLADLLVVGAFGTRSAADHLIGTVTDVIVTNSPCSVSVLRGVSPATAIKEMEGEQPLEEDKYLLPVDATAHSKAMVESVLKRPWPEGAYFKIVSIVQPLDTKPFKNLSLVNPKQLSDAASKDLEQQREVAQKLVDETARRFKEKFSTATVSTEVLEGHPREVILDLARDWPADLVVCGSRKIKGVASEIRMGAISKAILFHSPCSVELVR